MTRSEIKVLSVFGTRPEAVKMAPILDLLAKNPRIESTVAVTAQHREMLDQVLDLFAIEPDFDLNIMQPNQPLHELTAAIFLKLNPILEQVAPQWVLVQGDTTTAMATAMLAYYHTIRVGHVEAGLRTDDKWQPFPEEINRKVVGTIADLHFAPTKWAEENLVREGVSKETILVTGNPVIDALQHVIEMPYDLGEGPTGGIPADRKIILVTAHRRENFGEPLEAIFSALIKIAEEHTDEVHLVYPVHMNPNVRNPAQDMLASIANVSLLEPLDYLPMVHLMKRAYLILTDSGGIQEEAPALGTPVLVLREKTERPEAIEAGTARLVGTDTARIVNETQTLLHDAQEYEKMAMAVNPFGDGHAAERVVEALISAT
jgi:UDP-N-acetylglucosamine 2-epimerase (non-hydrolysing)